MNKKFEAALLEQLQSIANELYYIRADRKQFIEWHIAEQDKRSDALETGSKTISERINALETENQKCAASLQAILEQQNAQRDDIRQIGKPLRRKRKMLPRKTRKSRLSKHAKRKSL